MLCEPSDNDIIALETEECKTALSMKGKGVRELEFFDDLDLDST